MAVLTNKSIASTYKSVLSIGATTESALTSSIQQLTDGLGNGSPLSMSTTQIQFNAGSNTFKFPTTRGTSGQILKLADANGTLDWVADASGNVTKTGTIALNTIAVWNDNVDQLRSDTSMSINTNHNISLLQTNSNGDNLNSYNIGGGNIANVTGSRNVGFGKQNLNAVLAGSDNTAMGDGSLEKVTSGNKNTGFGSDALGNSTSGDFNTAVGSGALGSVLTGEDNTAFGYNAGANVSTGSDNTYIGKSAGLVDTGSNNIYIGEGSGSSVASGNNNVILGSNTGNTISATSNNIIISDGSGNNRLQFASTGAATFNSSVGATVKINTTDATNNYISFQKSGVDFGYLGTGSSILSSFVAGDVILRSEGAIKLCNGNNAALTVTTGGRTEITTTSNDDTLILNNTGTYAGSISFNQRASNGTLSNAGYVGSIRAFEGNNTADNGVGLFSRTRMSFYINSTTPSFTIASGGNFTLGGDANLNGSLTFGTSSSQSLLGDFGETNTYLINYNSGGTLRFYVGGGAAANEKLVISSGGDVTVNTGKLFVSNGNIIGGSASDITGTHYFNKGASVNGGILYAGSSTTGRFSLVVQASDTGYNDSPATCLKVGATSSTSRSISAAGTFNASGADYAEYMIKSTTDPINKGDIVGVNSDGLLTNIFNDAISFVIKSTDPSFVGNDTWGIESEDEDDIEEARIIVDRVAFSGQVPCNVTSASVGDYIIPVASSDGKITGEAVSDPTFEQYKLSVGKVWKIMEDGRSWVAVKIG